MNIVRSGLCTLALCGAVVGVTRDSEAVTNVNGQICRAIASTATSTQNRTAQDIDRSDLDRSIYGVHNIISGNAVFNRREVHCPLPRYTPNTTEPTSFAATVYNRSTVHPLECTILRLNFDGNVATSAGGAIFGADWNPKFISMTLPAAGGIFQNNYILDCILPGIDSNFGANSHVTSIAF